MKNNNDIKYKAKELYYNNYANEYEKEMIDSDDKFFFIILLSNAVFIIISIILIFTNY